MCTLKVGEIEKMLKVRDISITLTKGASQKWFLYDNFDIILPSLRHLDPPTPSP